MEFGADLDQTVIYMRHDDTGWNFRENPCHIFYSVMELQEIIGNREMNLSDSDKSRFIKIINNQEPMAVQFMNRDCN